jgi:hypothetical protein
VSSPAHKKVLVVRFEKAPIEGFASLPSTFVGELGATLEVLSQDGAIASVPLAEIRAICFVRDFGTGESWRKQRIFLSRPKTPGLWVRVQFRDGELLEAVTPNNLLGEPGGFLIVPPDPSAQNYHLFVPRSAVSSVEVLGVIGSPLRRRSKPTPTAEEEQLEMFS